MRIARTAFLSGVLLVAAMGTPAMAKGTCAEGPPRSPAGWMLVASPNVSKAGPGGNQLYDVASPDGAAVWAVGTSGQTLAEYLGVNGWEIVRTPRFAGGGSNVLRAVDGTSANDVWAVGDRTIKGSRRRPLIERWDGAVWRVVPGAVAINGSLRDVVAIGPDDAWAVGSRLTTTPNAALLESWNGSGWLPVLGAAGSGSLVAVSASDGSNVWAAGTGANGSAFVERRRGSTWKAVSLGPKLPPGARLSDVLVLGPKDVWLAGRAGATAADPGSALTAHWDGSSWSYPPMPEVAGADALASLTARERAVGGRLDLVGRPLRRVRDADRTLGRFGLARGGKSRSRSEREPAGRRGLDRRLDLGGRDVRAVERRASNADRTLMPGVRPMSSPAWRHWVETLPGG